ncbi:MAG TPA: hypothetical protein DEP91_12060 [Sphingomonas bacterium]|uniref:Uncharacterized protein n=1 Tax=Sphingomonas bacterium TaxID=1895847 RepID=A0A3D0WGI4_9SPHN|nr:hypothetical protein [Sphingomonas bacterium]
MLDSIGNAISGAARGVADLAGRVFDASDARQSDTRDDVRSTGRDGVRPGRGDGPATPGKSTITPSPGMPGYPTPPAAPSAGDGSGAHASEGASIADHINEAAFYRVADAADAMGLDNAARHMRHYLGNSGETLSIDPKAIRADIPAIREEIDASFETDVRAVAEAHVRANYTGEPMTFQVTTPWTSTYAGKELSQDWFFAVGGFSYAHTATVTVTPGANGAAQVSIDSDLHVFDRYNWDEGKGVDIGPLRIGDEQLGQLHQAGLAQEFEVRGSADGPSARFTVAP